MLWHEQNVRFKPDKAVVKLRNPESGEFLKSVIIPTDYYPLNGKYEVFTYANTEIIRDEKVLDIFDSVKYRVGKCYQNTLELVGKLKEAGYSAIPYVGWAFINSYEVPVHHCWCVLNGKHLLDLGDEYTLLYDEENRKNFDGLQSKEEQMEVMVSFREWANLLPNRARCYPVGVATPPLLYIGCPCEPEEGRNIYRSLLARFPNHECEANCDGDGWNALQRKYRERGLM